MANGWLTGEEEEEEEGKEGVPLVFVASHSLVFVASDTL